MVDRAEVYIRITRHQRECIGIVAERQAIGYSALLDIGEMARGRRGHVGNAQRIRLMREVAIRVARREAPVARVVIARIREAHGRVHFLHLLRRQRQQVACVLLAEVRADLHGTGVVDELDLLGQLMHIDDCLLRLGDDAQDHILAHARIALDHERGDRYRDMAGFRTLDRSLLMGLLALRNLLLLLQQGILRIVELRQLIGRRRRCWRSCCLRHLRHHRPGTGAQRQADAHRQTARSLSGLHLFQDSHNPSTLSFNP